MLLKYLYDCLPEVFKITRTILDEQEYQKKIMKLDTYLSDWKLEQLNLEIKEAMAVNIPVINCSSKTRVIPGIFTFREYTNNPEEL